MIEVKPEPERREHQRVDLACPCKVYDPGSCKYVPGLTWNVSKSGVMLEVARPMELRPGDRLFVGMAMKRRQALLLSREMLPCEVIRVVNTTTKYTAIGARFVDESCESFDEAIGQRYAA
jgi:hypothetical protein